MVITDLVKVLDGRVASVRFRLHGWEQSQWGVMQDAKRGMFKVDQRGLLEFFETFTNTLH